MKNYSADMKIGNGIQTDIDRLHNVFEGRTRGRGCGKTMLLCHQIAGQLEVAPQDIVVCIPNMYRIEYFVPILSYVLVEHGFEMRRLHRRIFRVLQTNTKIEFHSVGDMRNSLIGRDVPVFWEK